MRVPTSRRDIAMALAAVALAGLAAALAAAVAPAVAQKVAREPVKAAAPAAKPASAAKGTFVPKARHVLLMDATTGAILFQKDADTPTPPASMSKLMTVAVVFKALKAGELKLDQEMVMSVNAWRKGGAPSGTSAMMVPVNTKVTVGELLQGVIVQSGNDAAMALAEGMAGTEEAFARLMEAEARRIGLATSTFRNSTGLHHPEHLMSARELALLARHLMMEYPDHYGMFAQSEFKYRKHRFINRNPLLFLNIGADGLKTGYIKEAGYGIVASAKQEERRLIAVIGGAETANERRDEAARLLDHGFKNYSEFRLFEEGETVGQARVWGGASMYVSLAGKGPVNVILPRYPANQRLKADIVYKGPLKTPIAKGDQVAVLRVTSTSNAVNEVPLYAQEDVAPAGLVRRGLDTLVHMAFRWVLL